MKNAETGRQNVKEVKTTNMFKMYYFILGWKMTALNV
jgi:hypothetical protein